MTASETTKAGKRIPKTSSGKPQPKVKKQIPTEDKLKKLFNSLCSQIDGGHFVNGIHTCDKILTLSPGDEDATKTKIWLLLQTERYERALELLDASDMPFEQAYTLYRLNKLGEARTVLANAENADDNGVKHLEAQMNYREGLYDAAVDIYEKLLDSLDDPEEISDIQTNIQASTLHLDFINSGYLRALDKLPSSVTSSLESAPPPTVPTVVSSVPQTEVVADVKKEEKAPKKPRIRRLPKHLPPNAPPPDPERWLKKSERTLSMAGKKRKGGGATQGAAVEPTTTTTVSSTGGSSASGKKGKKKK